MISKQLSLKIGVISYCDTVSSLGVVRKETHYATNTSTLSIRVETPDRRACARRKYDKQIVSSIFCLKGEKICVF